MDPLENFAFLDLWDELDENDRTKRRQQALALAQAQAQFSACGRAQQRRLKGELARAARDGRADEVQRLLGAWRWWPHAHLMDALQVAASEAVVRAFAAAEPDLLRGGNAASALHSAASDGRERALAALLSMGLDPNARASWARVPPLHAACAHAHMACVRLLLEHGADANGQVMHFAPALHFAAVTNSVECVELLLQHGAAIDAGESGRTPLCYAADAGAAESVRLLVARGADPNVRFSTQDTPLLLAAKGRTELRLPYHTAAPNPPADYRACVKELIRSGADPQVADEYGYNVLYYAIKDGSKDLFDYFTDGIIDVSSKSTQGETPLHWAALWARTEFIRDLLSAGIDINSRRNDGKTPLHLAVDSYKEDCVGLEELLNLGADVHAKDNEGWTALHLACSNNFPEMVAVLLRAGADTASTTHAGETPLHVAAWTDRLACVTRLLDAGASIDAAADDGKTAVHHAAQTWSTSCLEELARRGADLLATDLQGWTALHCAADAGAEEAVAWLARRGVGAGARSAAGETPLHVSARAGQAACAARLLRLGAAVDARDAHGRTALHAAAAGPDQHVVRALLEGGADRRARDAEGHAPADLATDPDMRRLIRCWAIAA